jgi:hypothetical protein
MIEQNETLIRWIEDPNTETPVVTVSPATYPVEANGHLAISPLETATIEDKASPPVKATPENIEPEDGLFPISRKRPDKNERIAGLTPSQTDSVRRAKVAYILHNRWSHLSASDKLPLLTRLAERPLLIDHQTRMELAVGQRHHRQSEKVLKHKQSVRRWMGGICLGIVGLSAGAETIPQALGQPSVQTDIFRTLESNVINLVGGPQLREQAAIQAEIDNSSTNQFLIDHANQLKNVQGGDTFMPEWNLPGNVNAIVYSQSVEGQAQQQVNLNILKFEVEKLGIKQIRLGIRWQNTLMPDGSFSLAYYQPYLDYLSSYKNPSTGQGVSVLLGIGPLKSPGWPESYVPTIPESSVKPDTSLIPTGNLPPNGAEITPNMPYPDLILKAKEWLDTVMLQVVQSYPTINYFELDNEPRNHAGPQQWIMSPSFEKEMAQIVLSYQPNASFMVNWSGTADLAGSVDFKNAPSLSELIRLMQKFSSSSVIQEMLNFRSTILDAIKEAHGKGNVTLGLDSYQQTPFSPSDIPVKINGETEEIQPDTTTVIEITEQLAGDKNPWQQLANEGVPVSTSELQASPWGSSVQPGNDPDQLKFMIARALETDSPNTTSTMGFWTLSQVIYNLLYNQKQFATSLNPIKMDGPAPFVANNWEELQIIAAVTGVSQITQVNGRWTVDNSKIDAAMNQYLTYSPNYQITGSTLQSRIINQEPRV